jgi:hypothetical protein
MPRGTFFSLAAAFASGLIQPRNPDVVLAALSRMRKVEIDGFLYKGRANKSSLLEGREFFFFFFFFFIQEELTRALRLSWGVPFDYVSYDFLHSLYLPNDPSSGSSRYLMLKCKCVNVLS